ncbi:uncharacterized protein A1O9_04385, partial [Exophiala aquamarina CBS 119918]
MPCPWSRRCNAPANNGLTPTDALPSPTSAPDVEDWKTVRRYHLRKMRKQVRSVVLFMALMEALRVGPIQLVYAGKQGYPEPGPEDFGIAYTVGYLFSWLYLCAFMIVYVPLFSWWVPNSSSDSEKPSILAKVAQVLKDFNMLLLPFTIGLCLVQHLYYTACAFIYVDSRQVGSRKFPANTRKNWLVRFLFLVGIAISTSTGYGAFQILSRMDLAHVKPIEYAVVVIPFQINFGVFLGTIMQFRMERRRARKQ